MKKFFSLLLIAVLTLAMFAGCANNDNSKREEVLKIYTWADYNYEEKEFKADFEAYYKKTYGKTVKAIITTFATPEEMLTKIEVGKEDFDIACPSDYMIQQMIQKDLLKPINTNDISNYSNLSPYIVKQHETFEKAAKTNIGDNSTYSVSYMWGTMGLVYNKADFADTSKLSADWNELFNPENKGKVLIKDSMRDTYVVASVQANMDKLKKLDKNADTYMTDLTKIINDTSDENISAVGELLKKQKKEVKPVFEVDEGKAKMSTGEYKVGLAWSGDALWAMDEASDDVELGYIIPEIGSNIWFDGWVIPKYAKNIDAAHGFMNFLLQDDITIKNMDVTGYTSGVATKNIADWLGTTENDENGVEISLPKVDLSYFFNGVPEVNSASMSIPEYMYPSNDEIKHCAIMQDFKDKTDAVAKMWSAVKTDSLLIILIVMGSLLGAGVIALIVILVLKKMKGGKKTTKTSNTSAYRK